MEVVLMDELKRCPFCGYKADAMFYSPFDGYQGEPYVCRIWCLNCKAQIERDTFMKAMVDWNRRADDGK
jgi:Lar family restriction alleviation protein